MSGPTAPATGDRLLVALREGSVALPHARLGLDALTVSALGAGESYAAWLVTDGTHSLVFRLPRRPPEEMPTPMADEVNAARFIPEGVGSRVVAVDEGSDNGLGCPYLVSTFVPGSVPALADWDDRLLSRHARQLARLHQPRFDRAGPPGGDGRVLDLVRAFDESLAWWREAHPQVTGSAAVAALARDIRQRLVAASPAFEGTRYSFIHGDLVATNVVVDTGGTPRFIDWEWARIGDVAQDLAYVGGEVTGGPWYVRMSSSAVTRFLTEYLRARALQPDGQVEPLDRLRRRRDAWELVERFLSSLHFERQAQVRADPGPYPAAVRELRTTLRARLDAGSAGTRATTQRVPPRRPPDS